jgi:RNA polymerase sigma-70 factor (ECF subfamily)
LTPVVRDISDPATEVDRRDERDELFAALRSLTADQRAAVLLRYADGLSVRQIAQLINRSEPATESLLSRSRDRLRSLLRGLYA